MEESDLKSIYYILKCVCIVALLTCLTAFLLQVLINQLELIAINRETNEIIKRDFESDLFDKNQEIVLECLLNNEDKSYNPRKIIKNG